MHPTHPQPTTDADQLADAGTDGVDTTPAQVMRDAALYLERHGWTQRALYRHTPGEAFPAACAIGALAIVVYGEPLDNVHTPDRAETGLFTWVEGIFEDYLDAHDRLTNHDTEPPHQGLGISDWNDDAYRTQTDVIATLRAAAHDWDHTHGGGK
jgi:hypothetical protein